MSHTPGPWQIVSKTWGALEVHSINRRIAQAYYHLGSEDPEVFPNARLIAAAPDLLFAAEQALMAFEDHYDAPKIREDLRSAIDKAKGTTE